jgi:hypothetical protein
MLGLLARRLGISPFGRAAARGCAGRAAASGSTTLERVGPNHPVGHGSSPAARKRVVEVGSTFCSLHAKRVHVWKPHEYSRLWLTHYYPSTEVAKHPVSPCGFWQGVWQLPAVAAIFDMIAFVWDDGQRTEEYEGVVRGLEQLERLAGAVVVRRAGMMRSSSGVKA